MYINLFNNVLSPKIPGYIVLWNVLQKLPPKAAGRLEEGAWGEGVVLQGGASVIIFSNLSLREGKK